MRAAMDAYKRALSIDPACVVALNNLGHLHVNYCNEIGAGRACYDRALAIDPQNAGCLVNKGVLLFIKKDPPDFEGAEDMFKKALTFDPNHAQGLVNYANLLLERPLPEVDEPSPVQEAYQQDGPDVGWRTGMLRYWAAMDKCGDKEADIMTMYISCKVGDIRNAERLYKTAIHLHPDSSDGMCGYATLKMHERDMKGAEELYRQALQVEPNHIPSLSRYGLFLQHSGDLVNATSIYRRALKLDPYDVQTWMNLAGCLECSEGASAAIQSYRKVLELQPTRSNIWFEVGRLHQQGRNDLAAAKEAYETALDYNSENIPALNSLGLILTSQAEHNKAEALLQRAVRIAPDHHGVLCNYAGFLQSARHDLEGAEHFYKRSLLLAPDHVPTLCSYSTIQIDLHKNPREAREMLRRALDLMPGIDAVRSRLADVDEMIGERTAEFPELAPDDVDLYRSSVSRLCQPVPAVSLSRINCVVILGSPVDEAGLLN
eukprot:CAMPEP_0206265580 /NCGR_PEP_ID=MMETSP0047_2-20121206/30078_1 /ASSEMBLY_ACC=CAM_ASM_000192 /TAXON_ID=195065 /ORGANISM="Chroomonas mesostigmatica_cf, Strain CCMP1168" /LENGTH=487 /DNA_ID=CAMNT_0053693499 /DNA_START=1 /DNA_END=1465 /DNA_ORIENTATION=+